jgi:hypothetical protein
MSVKLRSHLPVEKQVQAIGATWLDQQILEPTTFAATNTGFAAAAQQARDARVDFLIKEGLAERRNTRVILAGNLLDTLRTREIESAAKAIAAKTGLIHQPAVAGAQVSGIYRRSVMLASGRFAVLDNGLGFALVPWRPVIETALGRRIAAVVRGDQVSWQLGRQRGISL